MKKLPVYLTYGGMYAIILIALYNFYNKFKTIEPIIVTQQTRTIVPIPILIIASVFLFIILLSVAGQIFALFIKYIQDHITMIVYPVMIIAIGFLQLAIAIMTVVRTMIETNAIQFVANLSLYINATETLVLWVIGGVGVGLAGLGYEIYLKFKA
jgi:hypothetical protein